MEERTRAYLRGRFGEHHRQATGTPPPAANEREWGFIPRTEGRGRRWSAIARGWTSANRGLPRPPKAPPRLLLRGPVRRSERLDDVGQGLASSDLVFDFDADHLPSVVLREDSYAEMLAQVQGRVARLLDCLEDDFGFDDLTIVFSGAGASTPSP